MARVRSESRHSIERMYREGVAVHRIAVRTRKSDSLVAAVVRDGVALGRLQKRQGRSQYHHVQIGEDYMRGYTHDALASKYNIHPETVRIVLNRQNLIGMRRPRQKILWTEHGEVCLNRRGG